MCRRTGGFRPQFLPSLAGISLLFSRVVTAASLWVHILAINLFAARAAYLQGEADATQHLRRSTAVFSMCCCKTILQDTLHRHTAGIVRVCSGTLPCYLI